ncbi:MAG: DUF4873 domain-containing protein [Sciscionella sp.]
MADNEQARTGTAPAEYDEGYTGPATLVLDDAEVSVTVMLRGHFQPIDGYYHWYGRVAENAELNELVGGKKTTAILRTPHGAVAGELSDPDPWQRYRITGRSTPPFPVGSSGHGTGTGK